MKKIPIYLMVMSLLATSTTTYAVSLSKKQNRVLLESHRPVEYYHETGMEAYQQQNWQKAIYHFSTVVCEFPTYSKTAEDYYYLGVSYYYSGDYENANNAFNNYLQFNANPEFFQESFQYKYSIAEEFRGGYGKRVFSATYLPRWVSGFEEALDIYDEVVGAMPSSELAINSLFYKGCLLWKMGDYRGAIDSFQLLIRRFPKHELIPQAYLNITKVYLDEGRIEFQNPDFIALAEVNVKKFEQDFPRDERVEEGKREVRRIKEVYAKGLFETGQFYERKCKPRAAVIYYENAIRNFPEANISLCCRRRLSRIAPSVMSRVEEMATAEAAELDALFNSEEFSIEDFQIEENE